MMIYKKINSELFKKLIINGTLNLKKNYQHINDLNVFPVPDGDTGTNMKMTMMEGVKQLQKINNTSFMTLAQELSDALLMGSKGNSGVILSQFFHGICQKINTLKKEELDIEDFIQVLINGYKMAYASVINPVEGTILTVLRESIYNTYTNQTKITTINNLIEDLIINAKISLAKTPELLSVLQKANVIDSGGQGYIYLLDGMLLYLNGVELKDEEELDAQYNKNDYDFLQGDNYHHETSLKQINLDYIYCTEFIIKLNDNNLNIENKRQEFALQGDSLILFQKEDFLKIHIHTNEPGNILTNLLQHGQLLKAKIDNMQQQTENVEKNKNIDKIIEKNSASKENKNTINNKKNYFLIAIARGQEIKKTLKDLKIDYIFNLDDNIFSLDKWETILSQACASNIIIFPNNPKKQLFFQELVDAFSHLNIYVMETQNIAQCYNALLPFDESFSLSDNINNMRNNMKNNVIAEIYYKLNSNNSSLLKEKKSLLKERKHFIAKIKNKIYAQGENLFFLIKNFLSKTIKPHNSFLTILHQNNPCYEKQIKETEIFLEKKYPFLEVEKIINDDKSAPCFFILE